MLKKNKNFIIICILSASLYGFADSYFEISKNLDVFTTLYRELNNYYVDETDPGKLMKTGIDAMLKSLDPYTTYIPESEIEDFRFMTTGQYGGIGAVITQRESYVYISEPYEGFPAQKAGLQAGDKILKIDGESAKDKTTEDVSKALKGEPNTEVELLIERLNSKQFSVVFKREKISVKSVPYYSFIKDNIAYVKLRSFTRNCTKDIKDALVEMKKEKDLDGIILDLRSNPGGLLNEAVSIVNLFVDQGEEVVSTKGKIKSWDKKYMANNTPFDTKTPIAVLINQSSASASEIVSGAIQDLDRGVVIGRRSYGKGLVQQTKKLSYNAQLKLTVAKYYIPSGRCIQALDYSNRNDDGSVGKVPDSLMTPFKTRNGRTVYDGGGIKPDILVEQEDISKILIALLRERLFFDYATEYKSLNADLDSNFIMDDSGFLKFEAFLQDKEFEYKTDTEKILEKLKKKSKEEEYFSFLSDDLNNISSQLSLEKKDDLKRSKSDIQEILSGEISSRYYYQEGRIRSSINYDLEINKALEILQSPSRYDSILKAL